MLHDKICWGNDFFMFIYLSVFLFISVFYVQGACREKKLTAPISVFFFFCDKAPCIINVRNIFSSSPGKYTFQQNPYNSSDTSQIYRRSYAQTKRIGRSFQKNVKVVCFDVKIVLSFPPAPMADVRGQIESSVLEN